MAEVELDVPSITCEGCAETITDTLKPMRGVHDVKTNIRDKRVQVRYDSATVRPDQIRTALESAGFTVS